MQGSRELQGSRLSVGEGAEWCRAAAADLLYMIDISVVEEGLELLQAVQQGAAG